MSDTPETNAADTPEPEVPDTSVKPESSAKPETPAKPEPNEQLRARKKPAPSARPVQRRGGGLGSFLAILALLLGGGLGWLYWQQQNALVNLDRRLQILQDQNGGSDEALVALEQRQQGMVDELQSNFSTELQAANERLAAQQDSLASQEARLVSQEERLASQETTLVEQREQLAAQDEQLAALRRELTSANLRITDSGAGASRDWLLAEAGSLLRMAQQRLLTARDVRAAIGLYLSADDVLKQLEDPSVFAVREVLARELATLRGLPEVDVPGLYVELSALAKRVDQLSVIDEANTDLEFVAPEVDEPAADAGWLESALGTLDRYFVVGRRDGAITPRLSDEQQYLIKRAIQLQIEQARLALLRGQQDLYEQALTEAGSNIEARLQGAAGAREALLDALTSLRTTAIQQDIPPLNATLTALRQLQPLPESLPENTL